jgi:hypothetical protein
MRYVSKVDPATIFGVFIMTNYQNKLGRVEKVTRTDGCINVYEFRVDPTLTPDELAACKRIEFISARWVLIDVINPKKKS